MCVCVHRDNVGASLISSVKSEWGGGADNRGRPAADDGCRVADAIFQTSGHMSPGRVALVSDQWPPLNLKRQGKLLVSHKLCGSHADILF